MTVDYSKESLGVQLRICLKIKLLEIKSFMNQYDIQQKIKTLVKIEEDFSDLKNVKAEISADGLTFKQWGCTVRDGSIGDAWIVQSSVEAENAVAAYSVFSKKLNESLPRICFVSQCFLDFGYESSLIFRKNNNTNNSFVFARFEDTEGEGLSFGKHEEQVANKLKDYQYPQVFKFLQECINTPNYYARIALLFAALEAMSGEVERTSCDYPKGKKYKTYNKDRMKEILSDDKLFNDLFGTEGLRHKLLHGSLFDFEFGEDYFSKIYKAIIKYFNKRYSFNITENVVSVPRSFNDKIKLLLFLKATGEIGLKEVIRIFTEDTYHIGHKKEGFEVIKRISNY